MIVKNGDLRVALESQGWSPTRSVPVDRWRDFFAAEGFAVLPQALAILGNFGGLTIAPVKHPDDAYLAEPILFEPIDAAGEMYPGIHFYERTLCLALAPVGELLTGGGLLLIASDGSVYGEWGNILFEYGSSFAEALESTLVFARRKPRRFCFDRDGEFVEEEF